MSISWPGHIKDVGGVRSQFHHMIDVVPTILEAAGIRAPESVDGIAQKPIEGVSMAYTFDSANAKAPSRRDTQYFADAQLAIHRAALARYENDRRAEGMLHASEPAVRTVEHWRGVTLPMGLLYERAAVEFWEGVAAPARMDAVTGDRLRAQDDGARIDANEDAGERS